MPKSTTSRPLEDTQVATDETGPLDEAGQRPASVGRFALQHRLGAGGMGVVYLAHDPDLDREVAVKIIQSVHLPDASGQALLLLEARAMARVQHPNVVTVHEAGIADDVVWIAMEYVRGATLTAWLRAGPRTWTSALDIMLAAGEGLAAVHAAGLLHRDVKPDNIMVSEDGRVRLMDFGLVHENARDRDGANQDSAALAGTPRYMAPEQFQLRRADALSDQYAWCVACWEAVYGVHPFPQETLVEVVDAVLAGEVAAPPLGRAVPGWLERVLRRGLAVDPARRFASLHALFAAIAAERSSFAAMIASKNAEALRIEVWLGSLLVPLFWILDWLVLKEWIWLALGLRLTCAVVSAAIILISRWRPGLILHHVAPLSFGYSQLVLCSVAVLCFLHGGYESPYYAGMMLLYMAVGQFFSWSLKFSLAFAMTGYGFYMAPLALGLIPIEDPLLVTLNQFFLLSTIVITVVSQVHRFRRSQVEFDERSIQERLLSQARAQRAAQPPRMDEALRAHEALRDDETLPAHELLRADETLRANP